jgi:hypothetical protein
MNMLQVWTRSQQTTSDVKASVHYQPGMLLSTYQLKSPSPNVLRHTMCMTLNIALIAAPRHMTRCDRAGKKQGTLKSCKAPLP